MDVQLPQTGCNIIVNATSFYNYSSDRYTRDTYYIYEGKAFKQSTATSTRQYDYTGTCLHTGDLVYKPETEVYFQFLAIVSVAMILVGIYCLMFKRFIK